MAALLFLGLAAGIGNARVEPVRLVCTGPLLDAEGHTDLAELERAAAGRWDLAREDAVVLLERRAVEWTADGRRVDTVHRVVRINADVAVEGYSDLRVAYDSLRTDLEVLSLRTYRDGQWIVSGPTAMVETTPEALDRSPDLSGFRERMLLHDGVGLPCLVETWWRVTDRRPFRGGTEGVLVFPREDPVVRAEFTFLTPAGIGSIKSGGGAPEPRRDPGADGGLERRTVTMDLLEPAAPDAADPAGWLPHVSWSTWADWKSFGAYLRDGFEGALSTDAAVRDSVRARAAEKPIPLEKARAVADFVATRVRLTDCAEALQRPWPRDAGRVQASGYGTALDRAALVASGLRIAGFTAEPAYRGRGPGKNDEGVATLGRMVGLGLFVAEAPDTTGGTTRPGDFAAFYDPGSGEIEPGVVPFLGRMVWVPGRDPQPVLRDGADRGESRLVVGFDLIPGETDSTWTGRAFVDADGAFSPYGRMVGLGDEEKSLLGSMVSSVLAGAEISGANLAVLQPDRVVAGMSPSVKSGKADELGRRRFVVGDPAGGLRALLPGDIHLYDQARRGPVVLPSALQQEVRLRLRLPADREVRLPEANRLTNGAGEFAVTVERSGEKVTITRLLRLDRAQYDAAAWPDLRALLLADRSDRNRMILYRTSPEATP